MDFMRFLVFVLIVLTVMVIVVLVGMLITYQHDSLVSSAMDARRDIKRLRARRYVTAKSILGGASSHEAVHLRDLLESYPKIRSESDEVAWEERWLPAMREYVGNRFSDADPAVTAFVDNEMDLSSARGSLVRAETSIARIEGNGLAMWLVRTFVGLSKKAMAMPSRVDGIRGQASDGVGTIKDVVNRLTGNAVDGGGGVTSPSIRKYGDQTYFATNGKGKASQQDEIGR